MPPRLISAFSGCVRVPCQAPRYSPATPPDEVWSDNYVMSMEEARNLSFTHRENKMVFDNAPELAPVNNEDDDDDGESGDDNDIDEVEDAGQPIERKRKQYEDREELDDSDNGSDNSDNTDMEYEDEGMDETGDVDNDEQHSSMRTIKHR